jgi:hypothetical protein
MLKVRFAEMLNESGECVTGANICNHLNHYRILFDFSLQGPYSQHFIFFVTRELAQ